MAKDKHELWQAALADIELSISKANFLTWFKNTAIISKKDGTATIGVPNAFTKEWLENKYNRAVLKALRNIENDVKEVRFVIRSQAADANKRGSQDKKVSEKALYETQLNLSEVEVDKKTNLNPNYTFDTFVVGSSNELAHAASLSISENLGKKYNPLFIYGGVGLGKTHLLQAIGNAVLASKKKRSVKYVSSEKFTSELITAIKNQGVEEFKNKYRDVDLLILDDVQFIAGKEKTQEEFFHTFNSLYEKDKQIILSSDRPPKAIPTLEERLRSRFEGGMIADISSPDYETRLAILKTKAAQKSFEIQDEVCEFIASAITTNIRELEGALNRVIATTHLTQTSPSVDKVKAMLAANSNGHKKVTPKNIMKVVSEFYDVTEDDLVNQSRKREIVRPRQICMYLIRNELKNSYPFIGDRFGGRDHTTVMHACEKIEKELQKSDTLSEEISLIKSRIFG